MTTTATIPRSLPRYHDVCAVELTATNRTIAEPAEYAGTWRKIVGTFRLYSLGEQRPYFSATGELWDNRRNDPAVCGQVSPALLAVWPDCAAVVRVHLADEHGVPMHAAANAAHWAGMTKYPSSDNYGRTELEHDAQGRAWAPAVLADHLRVTVEEARELRAAARQGWTSRGPYPFDVYAAWADVIQAADLPARWQADADAARAWIEARAAEVTSC